MSSPFAHKTIKHKVTFFIDDKIFQHDKGTQNGLTKAETYCRENMLSTNDIIKFDSETEYRRYVDLKSKENITKLRIQVPFILQGAFTNANNERVNEINYVADFVYEEDGILVVEDVKGSKYFISEEFWIKKKLFEYIYRDKYIKVVIRVNGEFIEYTKGMRIPKKRAIKQREERKQMKKELHEKEILEKKTNRELNRIKELRLKEKRTSQENARLSELLEKHRDKIIQD